MTADPPPLDPADLPPRLELVRLRRPRNRVDRLVRCQISALRQVLADADVGIVHIHDPELMAMAVVLRLFGRTVILDIHEDFPDQVLRKGWLPRWLRPVASTLARGLARSMPTVANHIVVADPAVAERFAHDGATAVSLVQNFPDVSEMPTESPARNTRRVVYLGSVTKTRGLFTMIDAARRASDRGRGFSLVVAGPFHPPSLETEARRRSGGLDIEFLGRVDRGRAWHLLLSSSVGVAVLDALPNYVDAQPTKVFEYLAAGLQVVASDFPQWQRLFGDLDEVAYVSPGDVEALTDRILSMLDGQPMDSSRRDALQQLVAEQWSWAKERSALLHIYDNFAAKHG